MARYSPQPIFLLRGSQNASGGVTALHSLPSLTDSIPDRLVSGNGAGGVSIWDITIRREETVWEAHRSASVQWIGYLDNHIYTQGRNDAVRVWDVGKGGPQSIGLKYDTQILGNKRTDSFPVNHIGFCPCDAIKCLGQVCIAIPDSDAAIKVLYINNPNRNRMLSMSDAHPSDLPMCLKLIQCPFRGVPLLFVGYQSGQIAVWDVNDGVTIAQMNICKEPITCLDIDSTSLRGICGSVDNKLLIWQLNHSTCVLEILKYVEITNPGIGCAKLRPDGRLVFTGGWDSKVRVYSWKTMKILAVLDFHHGTVQALTFLTLTDQVPLLVAGGKDNCISVWDVYSKVK